MGDRTTMGLRRWRRVRRLVVDVLVPGYTRWNGQCLRLLLEEHQAEDGVVVWLRYPPDHFNIFDVDLEFYLVHISAGEQTMHLSRTSKRGAAFFAAASGIGDVRILGTHQQELLRTGCTTARPPTVLEVRPPLWWRGRVKRPLVLKHWRAETSGRGMRLVLLSDP